MQFLRNATNMPEVSAATAAHHSEVRQEPGKIDMKMTEFSRIALIQFFTLIELLVAETRSIGP